MTSITLLSLYSIQTGIAAAAQRSTLLNSWSSPHPHSPLGLVGMVELSPQILNPDSSTTLQLAPTTPGSHKSITQGTWIQQSPPPTTTSTHSPQLCHPPPPAHVCGAAISFTVTDQNSSIPPPPHSLGNGLPHILMLSLSVSRLLIPATHMFLRPSLLSYPVSLLTGLPVVNVLSITSLLHSIYMEHSKTPTYVPFSLTSFQCYLRRSAQAFTG